MAGSADLVRSVRDCCKVKLHFRRRFARYLPVEPKAGNFHIAFIEAYYSGQKARNRCRRGPPSQRKERTRRRHLHAQIYTISTLDAYGPVLVLLTVPQADTCNVTLAARPQDWEVPSQTPHSSSNPLAQQ